MKWRFEIIVILTIIFQGCFIQKQQNGSEDIFRYIDLGNGIVINLGDDINEYKKHLIDLGEYYKVPGILFGGEAQEIWLFTDEKNLVTKFRFIYASFVSFDYQLESYKKTLGIPKIESQKAEWKDKRTKFSLLKLGENEIVADLEDIKKKR